MKIDRKDAIALLGFNQDKLLPLLLSVLHASFSMQQYPRTSLESLHTIAVIAKLMDERLRKRSVKSGIIQTMHKLTVPIEKNHVTQACKEIAQKVLMSLGETKLQVVEFNDIGNSQVEQVRYSLVTSPQSSRRQSSIP